MAMVSGVQCVAVCRAAPSRDDLLDLLKGLSLHVDHQDPAILTSTRDAGISTGLRSLLSPPWTGSEISDHEVNGTLLPNQGIHYMWTPGSSLAGPITEDCFCGEIP